MAHKFILGLGIAAMLFALFYWGGAEIKLLIESFTFILLTLLLTLFGWSLLKDKTPIITRYALLIGAEDTFAERRYTRIVTWVWLVFLLSLWLLKLNSLFFHLTFISLSYIAVLFYLGSVILFIGEFYIRQIFLPHHRGSSLLVFLYRLSTIPLKQIWQFDQDKINTK
ncbi:hypothetical protein THMIRHAM_08880 [Thiomicrorhabdus immobilis]|uniref:Uncharacterized protein n=1 Tax=Thiomicrorhabdus immobilis TaxID=2791037 RepID=A0ABN6CVS7_9GAMM|nr:hypothetical protein [Thiomicrorhabdus immobilis]BCN93103.1 hypothetical protein THMIRHAM_08880 [Thiomicrorhabdus immobilis]